MTENELDEILMRCNAATPGPWRSYLEGRDHTSGDTFIAMMEGRNQRDLYLTGATDADHDFIAHARQDIERSILEVRRLKAIVGE